MAQWGQGLAQLGLDKDHQVGGMMVQKEERMPGPVGGTEGYIPVGAGPKGTVEDVALGGSPDGTEGGALGLFQGLEPGQPWRGWPGFVLLVAEVLAGECSGSASDN